MGWNRCHRKAPRNGDFLLSYRDATFADIDRIESELKNAAKAITSVSGLVAKYRIRLQELCDGAVATKMPPGRELSAARIAQ